MFRWVFMSHRLSPPQRLPLLFQQQQQQKIGKRAGDEGKREKAAAFLPLFPLPIVRRVRSISLFPIFLLRGFCGGERAKEVT